MNEQNDFERLVADQLASVGMGTPPASAIEDTIVRAGGTRRLPEWLALIKESPMRTNNHLAVGSSTVRVAAIMAATLLLAVALAAAGVAGQQLLAANGPIVVAQDGSGDYITINEAIAAAVDGDEVLVAPGTYQEVVIIEADITLRGDGPREEVILEFGTDGPTIPSWSGSVPYGVLLVDSEATVSDLTVRGPNVAAAFVLVGGAPTLERVTNDLEGEFAGRAQLSVVPLHGAGATIRDSLLDGPVWHGEAGSLREYEDVTGTGQWVAEDNTLDGGFWLEVTDGSSFLRNTITDGGGFEFGGRGSVMVAENVAAFIELDEQSDGYTIRDNVVHSDGSDKPAIVLGKGTSIVEGNVITGVRTGIVVPEGASSTITGNQLDGLDVGIRVQGAETSAVIEGNRFCGNEQDLAVAEGSGLTLDASNEICEDAPAE